MASVLPRIILVTLCTLTVPAHAQHSHDAGSEAHHQAHGDLHDSMIFAGIPHMREASGTAWQPDSTPMHAWHAGADEWSLMTHFNLVAAYDWQSGPRGDDQFNSVNWLMVMASRPLGDRADFMLRTI